MKFFSPAPPYISNVLKGTGIIFYCKDCEKIVDVIPFGRKFVYKCAICKTKNVAFGTDKSIRGYFRLPAEEVVAVDAAVAAGTGASETATATIVKPVAEQKPADTAPAKNA